MDLNTVTKRKVRRVLEEQFRMDLTSKKVMTSTAIDRMLLSALELGPQC